MKNSLYFLFIYLLLCSSALAQPDTAASVPAVDELYLARDDGSGKAGVAAIDFLTTDIPIHCVVLLGTADTVVVKMSLVAVAVPGVKADTQIVSTSYTTKIGQNRVNFSGRPEGKWTAGKYRAEIYVNKTLAGKLEFEIRRPASNISKEVSNVLPNQSIKRRTATPKSNP